MHQHILSFAAACGLAALASNLSATPQPDWLIDSSSFKARVTKSDAGRELELDNGLLRRVIRLVPNAATVALDNLTTGESLLRGVKPEAVVEIDGRRFDAGGLKGQRNYAFLRPEWIEQLRADPAAFRFTGYVVGQPAERIAWKRLRHHAADAKWPPAGVSLRLDFAWPQADGAEDRAMCGSRVRDGNPELWQRIRHGERAARNPGACAELGRPRQEQGH